MREGVQARLMEEPVTQQQGGKNWELPGRQRRERQRQRQRQVRCTNVGRQGQSRERLFLVSPGFSRLQLSASRVLVGHQTVHVLQAGSKPGSSSLRAGEQRQILNQSFSSSKLMYSWALVLLKRIDNKLRVHFCKCRFSLRGEKREGIWK